MSFGISKKKRRVFVGLSIFLGILVSLIFFEVVLMSVRYFHLNVNIKQGGRISDADTVVLSFGESTTFGQWLPHEQNYSSLLEKALNDLPDKRSYRVVNLGWSGAISDDIVACFDKALSRFRPVVVIACLGHNDFTYQANYNLHKGDEQTASGTSPFNFDSTIVPRHHRGLLFPKVIKSIIFSSTSESKKNWIHEFDHEGNTRTVYHNVDSPIPKKWLEQNEKEISQNLIRNLGHISKVCRERSIPFILVGYISSLANNTLREAALEIGVPFVDNQITHEELLNQYLIQYDKWGRADKFHPNERGHKLMKNKILIEMESMGVIRRSIPKQPLPILHEERDKACAKPPVPIW
jgi:lysophospholipase L1-like esterase